MTNDDWYSAEAEYMRQERERLGGPPSPEEVAALLRDELAEAEAARVQALLVYYPGLSDLLGQNVPSEEPALLTREEVAAGWKSLQSRLPATMGRPPKRSFPRRMLPLAAMLAVGFFSGFYLRTASTGKVPQPQAFSLPHELHPIGARRGAGEERPHRLAANERNYLLVLLLGHETQYPHYRIELIDSDMTPPKVIWRSSPLQQLANRPFTIAVPRAFLETGLYRVELYGEDGQSHHLASYLVSVSP